MGRAGNPYRLAGAGPLSYAQGSRRRICIENNSEASPARLSERVIVSNLLSLPNDYTVSVVVQTEPGNG